MQADPVASLTQPSDAAARAVTLRPFLTGLQEPLGLASPPGSSDVYVVEKGGRVRIARNGALLAAPFLDVSDRVSTGTEQGLLGLAFHPRFEQNHRVFVSFTDLSGDTHVQELSAGADAADLSSAKDILLIQQPFANHNGGDLVFGPDGKLYVGTGDGGSENDPLGNGQNPASQLGKMLRVDVDVQGSPVATVALGLRNPWRYSFDRMTGDLYIADVGQDRYEEVDFVPKGVLNGQNFGWNIMEGQHCLRGDTCDTKGLTLPVLEYGHHDGCAITGGFVYRGKALPEILGRYFYADYCSGLIRSFRIDAGQVVEQWDWKSVLNPDATVVKSISSFGEDDQGELYIVSLEGTIFRFERRP